MEATTDVWEIPTESATRVGHPAPFPVELPQRLIDLYTYRGDLVLDPFMGAGSTAVAAVRTGRHYVGFDTDAGYIALAEQRIADERGRLEQRTDKQHWQVTVTPQANSAEPEWSEDFQVRAGQQGRKAQEMAEVILEQSGFRNIREKVKISCGVEVNFEAIDQKGQTWLFDVSGAFSVTQRPGLRRTDTLWKALGKAAVLHSFDPKVRLVLLTTDLPAPNSAGSRALQTVRGRGKPVYEVIEMLDPADLSRLAELARGQR